MATTVKRQTNNGTMIFTRRTEEEARKLFNEGVTISVMTADRNPADSLTTEIDYTKGEELFWNGEGNIACDFDQVIGDFSEWQNHLRGDHFQNHGKAESRDFSYWTCEVEQN